MAAPSMPRASTCHLQRSFGGKPAVLKTCRKLEGSRSCVSSPGRPGRTSRLQVQALRIDRKAHLEGAWQRQAREELQLQEEEASWGRGRVTELRDLPHLDRLLEGCGSAVVALLFYSRSCGTCRAVRGHYQDLCEETSKQRAGVRFLAHNINNEWDELTDVARFYRVRAVPTFIFLVGGAKVRVVSMADSRRVTGSGEQIRTVFLRDRQRMQQALRELLFRSAPSARK